LSGKGVNIGLPEDSEDPEMPYLADAPNWYIKLTEWIRYWKTCQLKAGNMGAYCRWMGGNCCYANCPARLFEETKLGLYPEAEVPQPVKDRVRLVDEAQKNLQNQVANINSRQNKQFKKLNKELEEIKKALEET
jgi:hypothetical protein